MFVVNPTILRGVQSRPHGKTVLGEDAVDSYGVLAEDILLRVLSTPRSKHRGVNNNCVVSDDFL